MNKELYSKPLTMLIFLILMIPLFGQNKIYWSENIHENDLIMSANTDGSDAKIVQVQVDQPGHIAIDSVNQKIYWHDHRNQELLWRSNLDGSGIDIINLPTDSRVSGLAVDPTGEKIYWSTAGQIFRCNLDGSNPEEIINNLFSTGYLTIDPDNGKIYWREIDKIRRADLNGDNMEDLISFTQSTTRGFAVDFINEKMYWYHIASSVLQRFDFDGGNLENLPIADISSTISIITVHPGANKIYWTEPNKKRVRRADLDGHNAEVIAYDAVTFRPTGLAINFTTGKAYVGNERSYSEKIEEMDLDGGNRKGIIGSGEAHAIEVDQRSGKIYWLNRQKYDVIQSANPDGSGLETIVFEIANQSNTDMVIDTVANQLYWVVLGQFKRTNLDGSNTVTLRDIGSILSIRPQLIEIDPVSEKLYWYSRSSISRMALDGTNEESLINIPFVEDMIIERISGKIYLIGGREDKVYRINLDGSQLETIADGPNHPRKLAIDALNENIYWAESADWPLDYLIVQTKFDGSSTDTLLFAENGIEGLELDISNPSGGYLRILQPGLSYLTVANTPQTQSTTVMNLGDAPVTVNTISIPAGEFTLSNLPTLPAQLSPGATLSFDVVYTPLDAGRDTMLVIIESDEIYPGNREVFLSAFALAPALPGVCYASTGYDDYGKLYTIDTTNTPYATLVGDILEGEDAGYPAIAINSQGIIYAANTEYDFFVISAADGDFQYIGYLGDVYAAMAFDENDVLYAIGRDSEELVTIDPATGDVTVVGSIGEVIVGMDFDPTDGTLYASGTGDKIYKIDKTNGAPTLLGTTGLGSNTQDIHFDAEGNLFGSKREELIAIDKTSGVGTVIGDFGVESVSGMDLYIPPSEEAEPDDIVNNVMSDVLEILNDPNLPTGAIADLEDACEELNSAVEDFQDNDAQEAYKGLEEAVDELMDALSDGADVQEIIDAIVDLAEVLVAEEQTNAVVFAGDPQVDDYIDDADKFYQDYLDELADGNFDLAIRRLASARKELQRAIHLGSAIAQGMDAEDDINAAAANIQNIIDTGGYSSNANADLEDAIEQLNDAIEDFNEGDIKPGFDDLQDAVEQLQDAEADGAVTTDEINEIVDLAKMLAEVKLAEAQEYAGNAAVDDKVADAQADMADADVEIAAGDHDVAVKEYRDAWEDARIALEHGRGLRKAENGNTVALPKTYTLAQNYPNPFNPNTTIKFALPEAGRVTLKIYNVAGQLVNTLVNENIAAGYHNVVWNGKNSSGQFVASGLYFYHLKASPSASSAQGFERVRKMILMK